MAFQLDPKFREILNTKRADYASSESTVRWTPPYGEYRCLVTDGKNWPTGEDLTTDSTQFVALVFSIIDPVNKSLNGQTFSLVLNTNFFGAMKGAAVHFLNNLPIERRKDFNTSPEVAIDALATAPGKQVMVSVAPPRISKKKRKDPSVQTRIYPDISILRVIPTEVPQNGTPKTATA